MNIIQEIAERKKIRDAIAQKGKEPDTFLLISESLDDYIEHRIETDKVLIGVLSDIQSNTAAMTDLDRVTKN